MLQKDTWIYFQIKLLQGKKLLLILKERPILSFFHAQKKDLYSAICMGLFSFFQSTDLITKLLHFSSNLQQFSHFTWTPDLVIRFNFDL